MEFFENGTQVAQELPKLGYAGREREDGSPLINASVMQADGMGVTVGNIGLPGYQVSLGFSEGSNFGDARKFADMMVGRLRERWVVDVVPEGHGAIPLARCRK